MIEQKGSLFNTHIWQYGNTTGFWKTFEIVIIGSNINICGGHTMNSRNTITPFPLRWFWGCVRASSSCFHRQRTGPWPQKPLPGWPQLKAGLEQRTAYVRGWGCGLTQLWKTNQNIMNAIFTTYNPWWAAEICRISCDSMSMKACSAILAAMWRSLPLRLWKHGRGHKQP